MAMNRAVFASQLEPGLNALFGLEYRQYPEQWREIFEANTSVKAFEEDVLLEGFGEAAVKPEGGSITFDTAAELWTARYNHDTIALAFHSQKKRKKMVCMAHLEDAMLKR